MPSYASYPSYMPYMHDTTVCLNLTQESILEFKLMFATLNFLG